MSWLLMNDTGVYRATCTAASPPAPAAALIPPRGRIIAGAAPGYGPGCIPTLPRPYMRASAIVTGHQATAAAALASPASDRRYTRALS